MTQQGKITILGSYNTDLMSYTPHIPVIGETVIGGPFNVRSGGKGFNQSIAAKMAAAVDSNITMISKIGTDSFADIAIENFRKYDMKMDFVYKDEINATGVATIL